MKRKLKNETGFALIAVLCMILTVSVLVASAVALSQYTAAETRTFSGYSRTVYIAESAAARAMWLLLNDRQNTPDRTLGTFDYVEADSERFMADAVIHQLNVYGVPVRFCIIDALSGFDISGNAPGNSFSSWGDQEYKNDQQALNDFKGFCNRLDDYVDADLLLRVNGLEQGGYLEKELYNLPRNRKMQFREEILLVPGSADYIGPDAAGRLSMFRLIPLSDQIPMRGRTSLYSSPVSQIVLVCQLTEQETAELVNAMGEWKNNRKQLSESLSPAFLSKLTANFSTSESSIYTILIDTSNSNFPGARLAVSFRPVIGDRIIQYYEYFFY